MKNNINGNAAQMEAILHKDGPAMVLAGPGSGKTFVIVQRLRHLIEGCSVDPSSILVITFTKAAAIEMQQRFLKITDSSYPEVCFGTFHSVFYHIVRSSTPTRKLKIINEKDKYRIIKDIVLGIAAKSSSSDKQEFTDAIDQAGDIISEISRVKNTGESLDSNHDNIPLSRFFEKIYKEYNQMLRELDLIDFDDMLIICYEELLSKKNLLDTWSERFKYVLIDEYQDINSIQYKVVSLLCKTNNLFVVGDDDQSIYGFRGSDPGIMQSFTEDYKEYEPKVINLNVNYRCGKDILDAALETINENKCRLQKDLEADLSNGRGRVYARKYVNKDQQNKAIASFLKNDPDKIEKIAFIFRTNSEAMALASVLRSEGISTNLDSYVKSFTDSPAVKLCENYLRFIYDGKKRELFLKIMNNPCRYISRSALESEVVTEAMLRKYYSGNADKIREIDKLFRQLNMISHMRPALSVRFLRKEIGIDKMFPGEMKALDELSDLSMRMQDNMQLLIEIDRVRDSSFTMESKARNKTKGKCVKLLTMHGSKGLEFDIVWLPGLNEGIIPSRSAVTSAQIEEERRMLYVGMTRAKSALIMSYITGNEENPMLPTRFIRPIRHLWEDNYSSSPSKPSSGSSISSSNSTSSR